MNTSPDFERSIGRISRNPSILSQSEVDAIVAQVRARENAAAQNLQAEHITTAKSRHPDHDARMELASRYQEFQDGKSRTAGSRKAFAEHESKRTGKTVTFESVKRACDYAYDQTKRKK